MIPTAVRRRIGAVIGVAAPSILPCRSFHSYLTALATPASSSPPFIPSHTALIFPGQGSQRCGSTVRSLEDEWPGIVRPVWQEMDETLKMNLSKIMKDGLASELNPTELAQPSILAHSYALWRVLSHTLGLKYASSIAQCALGHSLGEYTALVVAGSIPFASAVKLVYSRGLCMSRASAPGKGGMLALLAEPGVPLHGPSITQLCREAEAATDEPIDIANVNSPFQVVLSGGTKAIDHVKQRVKSSGKKDSSDPTRGILRAVALDVSGAFHSRLMQPAAEGLKDHLSRQSFAKPSVPVIFNVHAHPSVRNEKFSEYLLAQLTSPVQWHASILHALVRRDVHQFIELGPSTPLTAMINSTAQRLAKQPILDPLTHPVDAAADRIQPHASILPLILPKPKVSFDDGTGVEDKDVHSILAGGPEAWNRVQTVAATTEKDLRILLQRLSTPIPTPV